MQSFPSIKTRSGVKSRKNSSLNSGFLRPQEAAAYLNIGQNKLYELHEKDPDFPRKIRLSARCVGWRRESLDAWLELKEQQEASL